ncbi:MAG: hypothetical protein KAH32_00490 [Chlamydiia bacterium]|nr:hypothetical protein [Chlamydiia bacterium]
MDFRDVYDITVGEISVTKVMIGNTKVFPTAPPLAVPVITTPDVVYLTKYPKAEVTVSWNQVVNATSYLYEYKFGSYKGVLATPGDMFSRRIYVDRIDSAENVEIRVAAVKDSTPGPWSEWESASINTKALKPDAPNVTWSTREVDYQASDTEVVYFTKGKYTITVNDSGNTTCIRTYLCEGRHDGDCDTKWENYKKRDNAKCNEDQTTTTIEKGGCDECDYNTSVYYITAITYNDGTPSDLVEDHHSI